MDYEIFFSVNSHDREGSDTIVFLRRLLKEMDGQKFLIVWDNASMHKSKNMKRFLVRNRSTIITELLPPYAPELNPVGVQSCQVPRSGELGAAKMKKRCATR